MSEPTQTVTPTSGDAVREPTTLAGLLDDQRRRWHQGETTPVEAYLERHPGLIDRPEEALDLIYQEIVLREEAGQSPRLDEYQRRFPRWAAQLADQFEVHRAIESAGPATSAEGDWSPSAGGPDAAVVGRVVAGYEVLEVLGRGGMGVVYRARQLGLNRVVALKMILAGAYASPAAPARFRAEAEAVARLQHPNIVQVFQIAEHDGLPCLVLEYVPGGTLAQELDGTPRPPRRAAETAQVLARAMHYAHGQGVVHRDLKPGNVLLAADGTPKVADFGLAKLVTEGGETITRTGDILGTTSYMAPEQAGGPAAVGPAADVYSLGAILYEMLTGRPPFRAETAQETLGQVLSQEPVPPSRLLPRLSRDLETICLKCLENRPTKRYASAEALADDLRRFLDGRPIQARRVGPVARMARWAGRHPAVAGLTAAVASLTVAAAIGLVLSSRNDRQLRIQAEENLAQARQVVDEMYTKVAADLEGRPGMDAYQRTLLEKALRFYQTFALRRSYKQEVRHETGEAGLRVGDIAIKLGRVREADAAYRDALRVLEPLAGQFPAQPRYRETLAAGLNRAGRLAQTLSRTAEAEAALRRAVTILERLIAESPQVASYRAGLARVRMDLGVVVLQAGRLAEAQEEYQKARALAEVLVREEPRVAVHRAALGASYSNLGRIAGATGRWAEAASDLRQAVAEYERLTADEPKIAKHRSALAGDLSNAGNVATMTGRWDEAKAAFLRAEPLFAGLVAEHPDVSPYRKGLAVVRLNLGELHRRARRLDEANTALRQAVPLWEKLVADEPEVAEHRANLALCLNDLGLVCVSSGRPAEAEAAYRRAVPIRESLAADHPEQVEFAVQLGGSYGNLGQLDLARGAPSAAIVWLDRSLRALDEALRKVPRHALAAQFLRNGYYKRAEALTILKRYPEALADWDRALELAGGEAHEDIRLGRALTLARMGDHARATAEAARVAHSAANLYDAACIFALSCSALQGMNRPPTECETTAAGYAARAVALLHRARRAGHFDAPANVKDLVSDHDLDALRSRADFRLLMFDVVFPADVFAPR